MNWYMCVLKQTSDIEKRRTHSERERLETSTSTRGGRSPVGASATRGRDPDEGHVIRGSRRREARSCRRREATCRGRHRVGIRERVAAECERAATAAAAETERVRVAAAAEEQRIRAAAVV